MSHTLRAALALEMPNSSHVLAGGDVIFCQQVVGQISNHLVWQYAGDLQLIRLSRSESRFQHVLNGKKSMLTNHNNDPLLGMVKFCAWYCACFCHHWKYQASKMHVVVGMLLVYSTRFIAV